MSERTLARLSSQFQLSDRLIHLIYLTSSLLFLSGNKGSGKSTIVEKLSNSLPENTVDHILTLNAPLSDVEVREKLLSLLFQNPLFNSNDDLLTSLHRLQDNHCFQDTHLIIIDNAELLSKKIILELVEIIKNKQKLTNKEFNILLCCSEDYSNKMTLLVKNKYSPENAMLEELKLQALSSFESSLLLKYELEKTNSLNDEKQLSEKLIQCEGNPLQIIKLANEKLGAVKKQDQIKNSNQKKKSNVLNIIFIFVFLLAFGIAALSYFNSDFFLENKEILSAVETEKTSQNKQVTDTPKIEELVVSWSDEVEISPPKEVPPLSKENNIDEKERVNDISSITENEILVGGDSSNSTALPTNEVKPIVVSATEVTPPLLLTELSVLQKISSAHYTLQIASMSSKQSFDTFAKKYQLPQQNTFVYRAVRDKKRWFIVSYGNYKTLKEASAANNNLPSPFNHSATWIKKFSLVHKELREYSE